MLDRLKACYVFVHRAKTAGFGWLMGIVPGLLGRCDLVLRTALAICAFLDRPGRLIYCNVSAIFAVILQIAFKVR